MNTKHILCKCGSKLEIVAQVCCMHCNRTVQTKAELKERSISISAQIHALRMEQTKIDIELFQRSEHQPSRKYLLYEDFFHGVKKAKREDKGMVGKRDVREEARRLLEGI